MKNIVQNKKKAALAEVKKYLAIAEKATKTIDIELNLLGAKRVLSRLYDDFHLLNEFGEVFMIDLEVERREVVHERLNGMPNYHCVPFSPR